jgi:hypothetical protein
LRPPDAVPIDDGADRDDSPLILSTRQFLAVGSETT